MRYEIKGETLPVVVCELENGEKMITERGSMSWMSPNMKMETGTNGGLGKAFGRMFSGEAMFQNTYTAMGGAGMIAFASSFPGKILAFDIEPGRDMQRLSGQGTAFVEFDGHIVEYDLAPGQQIIVDTGYLAALESTCSMDIQSVPGLKNMVFGGEGLFNTVITGPGHIWLQTMPINAVANEILKFMPARG